MKENMKIEIREFVGMIMVFFLVINTMVLVIGAQAIALSRRPVPVPVTTVEIDGKSYTGQIWGDDHLYAILNDGTLLFISETPGSTLNPIENWMQLTKKTRTSIKKVVIDDSISSIEPYALGTGSFKSLETISVEGHQAEVGAYAFAWIPQTTLVEFHGGVDEFGINALHDHYPSNITGANLTEEALHYNPFR